MSTTAPNVHTPAYKIFHYYISCAIPAAYALESRHALEGSLQYDSEAKEVTAANEMIQRQHTVAELIGYYKRGATIIISDPEDTVKMYTWLKDHLSQQKDRATRSLNGGPIPLSDLRDMDEFATYIYRIARNFEKVDSRQSTMNRKLENSFGRRKMKRLRIEEPVSTVSKKIETNEHHSVTDDISQVALERGLPNK
jgi:hypothetical protein